MMFEMSSTMIVIGMILWKVLYDPNSNEFKWSQDM